MDPVRKDIIEAMDSVEIEPLFGRGNRPAAPLFPPRTEYRYFMGNLELPAEKAELERLMTCSMRCQGALKKPGDVCVISETGAFDKEGGYSVVIKYLCLPGATPEKEKPGPPKTKSSAAKKAPSQAGPAPAEAKRRAARPGKNRAAAETTPEPSAKTRKKARA